MAISKRVSFQRKVAELAEVADLLEKGKKPDRWFPETIDEFRSWESPGKFESWVSKAVDAPSGNYPELALELRKVFSKLEKYSVAGLRKTIREQAREISALAKQNIEIESLIRELSDRLEIAGKMDANLRSNIIRLYR